MSQQKTDERSKEMLAKPQEPSGASGFATHCSVYGLDLLLL